MLFNSGPEGDLGSVAEQITNDGSFLESFFDLKEGLAGYEAIADGFIPGLGVFPLTYYDVDTVVFLVKRLARTLYAIADDGYHFVFQNLLCLGEGKFFAGDYILFYTAEIEFCHEIVFVFIGFVYVTPETSGKVPRQWRLPPPCLGGGLGKE